MRTTTICLAQHIGRGFRFQWHLKNKRSIPSSGAAEILAAKGIKICDPKDILSPPYFTYADVPLRQEVEEEELEPAKRPCFVFHERYSPPAGMAQAQHLTNSIVRSTLPQRVLDQMKDNTEEEDLKVQEVIRHSQLMDSHQEKLPRFDDVVNRPGWKFPREWGSPVSRRNKQMSYKLQLLLDQLLPGYTNRHLITNTNSQVSLEHSGRLIQMKYKAPLVLISSNPLSAVAEEDEILASEGESLPDIYPFSPFLHCKKLTQYSDKEFDCLATRRLFPHTLFFHMDMPYSPHNDDTFGGLTLMKAFGHAAAYAKSSLKIEKGNLETPLTLQVVHTTGKKFHIGVFQLNTLDLCGPRKNFFWHLPREALFDACKFKGAEANLEGYNPRIFSLLRALHLQ
ncbi:large ribosomal subunit protein mL37-like [Palaemon carinicauda]|uniref:large ribosomal subunit protein mL37-like n=1 Tax=Palaemon carinicauda TaxID=392227 RepID=UPI0035B59EDB